MGARRVLTRLQSLINSNTTIALQSLSVVDPIDISADPEAHSDRLRETPQGCGDTEGAAS